MAIGDIVTQVLRCVCVKVLQYDQERLHNPSMNDATVIDTWTRQINRGMGGDPTARIT